MGTTPGGATDEEAAIRALENDFAAALNGGDIDAMMKNYVQDDSLVVFDVVPPRQHRGPTEYRKAWSGYFAHFKRAPKFTGHPPPERRDRNYQPLVFLELLGRERGTKSLARPLLGRPPNIARARALSPDRARPQVVDG